MKTNIKELEIKGFVSLAYPKDLRSTVDLTIAAWKKFCDLPIDIKKNLPYSNNADGVGYELKDGIGNKADRKENCDIALGGKEWLEVHVESIKNPVVLEFFTHAINLVGMLRPIIHDFAEQTEKAFDLKDFGNEVDQSENNFFIRFIHYFGDRKVGEETASSHADQSGFTLHLFESAPGLQCLTYEKQWIDMPVSEGETVIIPAMQMQLRSSGKLKALCHRVVATPETAKEGRYSAVCFVQLKNTPKYDKEKSGRLQEKLPGFNYEMTHENFVKLFKTEV